MSTPIINSKNKLNFLENHPMPNLLSLCSGKALMLEDEIDHRKIQEFFFNLNEKMKK
jgi:hypothetical protein